MAGKNARVHFDSRRPLQEILSLNKTPCNFSGFRLEERDPKYAYFRETHQATHQATHPGVEWRPSAIPHSSGVIHTKRKWGPGQGCRAGRGRAAASSCCRHCRWQPSRRRRRWALPRHRGGRRMVELGQSFRATTLHRRAQWGTCWLGVRCRVAEAELGVARMNNRRHQHPMPFNRCAFCSYKEHTYFEVPNVLRNPLRHNGFSGPWGCFAASAWSQRSPPPPFWLPGNPCGEAQQGVAVPPFLTLMLLTSPD